MKLRKLLPIAITASAIMSIAPAITSCGHEAIAFETVTTESLFNNQFKRTTDIAQAQSFKNANEVLEYYLQNTKDNHQIYIDDVCLSTQDILQGLKQQETYTFSGFTGTVELGVADIDPQNHRLSFGIKLDTTISMSMAMPVNEDSLVKFNLKLNIEAKNIKFELGHLKLEDKSCIWWAHPAYITDWKNPYDELLPQQTIDPWLLTSDHNWSFNYDGQITILESTIPEIKADLSINGSYNWKSVKESASLFILETFYSHLWHRVDYLKNIVIE